MSQLHADSIKDIKEISDEQMNSKYFHCELKGCELEPCKIKGGGMVDRKGKEGFMWINGFWCKTHKIELCRCGYCFKFHK